MLERGGYNDEDILAFFIRPTRLDCLSIASSTSSKSRSARSISRTNSARRLSASDGQPVRSSGEGTMTAEMPVAGTASTGLPEDHAPAQPLSLLRVLDQEFTELHAGDPGSAGSAPPADMLELYQRIHGLTVPRAALCLSGGGIRSASFALGVLQALASYGLLRHFHYLSTVSGGGYIGSWVSAWRFHQRNDEAVFNALAKRSGYPVARDETFAEPAELQQLRANSNFLTPRLGAFSADAWTGVALYIRNFLLNWFIFAPLFLGPKLQSRAACRRCPRVDFWSAARRAVAGGGPCHERDGRYRRYRGGPASERQPG